MGEFGFTISKGRQIDFDANDRSLAEYLYATEPSFRLCIECGGCAATCTTGNLTRFSLRELNILIKRGETGQVYDAIRLCMLCGKCSLVCPRGVNTRNIVTLVKKVLQNNPAYAF